MQRPSTNVLQLQVAPNSGGFWTRKPEPGQSEVPAFHLPGLMFGPTTPLCDSRRGPGWKWTASYHAIASRALQSTSRQLL